jgi:hypothetical protein
VPYRWAVGCGNALYEGKGYYHNRLCGVVTHNLFLQNQQSASGASTPTHGGDTFGTRLAKVHRFGSSGLNLSFEGLLLGVSLRPHVKGTSSDPRQSVLRINNTFDYPKGVFVSFCRRLKTLKIPKLEARGQRHHVGYQPEVTTSAPACGSVPLVHRKVVL